MLAFFKYLKWLIWALKNKYLTFFKARTNLPMWKNKLNFLKIISRVNCSLVHVFFILWCYELVLVAFKIISNPLTRVYCKFLKVWIIQKQWIWFLFFIFSLCLSYFFKVNILWKTNMDLRDISKFRWWCHQYRWKNFNKTNPITLKKRS